MQLALNDTPTATAFKLRDYQLECIEALRVAYLNGVKSGLVVLPTGSGKTVVFSHIPNTFGLDKKMLVLAHRAELLNQAKEKIEISNPELEVHIEQAGRRAPRYADVVIASVATIGRYGSARLKRMKPDDFGIIICDEAHHSPAKSYTNIFDHFPDALLIGFTATPRRTDGIGLEHIYQEIVFSRDLRWMIEQEYLCQISGFSVDSDTDLGSVKTRMGDFALNELAEVVDTAKRNQLILDAYRHLTPGQKALVFCVDVSHSKHMAEAFNGIGVRAAAITGTTPPDERAAILREFKTGEIKVLSNCMVLTEGFDEPSIEAVIMARPTQSSTLYQQMIGRGMRLFPSKEKLTVIDVADNASRHSLLSLPVIFGLPPRFNAQGQDIVEAAEKYEELPPHIARNARSFDDFNKLVKEIDMFAKPPEVDPLAARYSRMFWLQMPDQSFQLGLKDNQYLKLGSDLLGKFTLTHHDDGNQFVGEYRTLKSGLQAADAWVAEHRSQEKVLYEANAGWRTSEPSKKQIGLLDKLKIPYSKDSEGKPKITKGQASALIAERFARKG